MRGFCLSTVGMIVTVSAAPAQVTVKLVVPLAVSESLTDAGLRQRVERIIEREVRFRFEYELFIKDLTALGRQAVPHILGSVGHAVADRYVTEALLRIGGQDVRKRLESVITEPDANWRQAFLSGVPAPVHGNVRPDLAEFLHDRLPEVRFLKHPGIRARARQLLEQTAFSIDQQRRWGQAKRL